MTAVEPGDRVHVHYTGRLEDGTVFDCSPAERPLAFLAGPGSEVIEGLAHGVLGLAEGDRKTITVPPAQAFGERHPDATHRVARSRLPADAALGDPLRAETPGGTAVVWLVAIDESDAVLDVNHPLAGRTLLFEVEILSIEKRR